MNSCLDESSSSYLSRRGRNANFSGESLKVMDRFGELQQISNTLLNKIGRLFHLWEEM